MPSPENIHSSGAPMAEGAATPSKNVARKSLLDSMGLDSSVDQTLSSAYNGGEAQRLLESSGIATGTSLGSPYCSRCDCNYQTGHNQTCNQRVQPVRYQNIKTQQNTTTTNNIMTDDQLHAAMSNLHQPGQIDSMSMEAQTIRLFPAYFIAELLGTFLLVFIGDGAIAAFVFNNRPIDSFTVCLAFGVGAMIATYVCAKVSGAHLNPAATVAMAVDNRLKWELVPVYVVAQYSGGFLAAVLLFFNYSEAINAMDGGNHTGYGFPNSTAGVFATYPAPFVSVWGSIIDQVIGTALLLFALTALSDRNNLALEERFQPPIVAFAIGLVCFAFSVNCGAIFNPARDLSPRILTALLGYPKVWDPIEGTYWYIAGIIAPHIGAILGVYGYKYLIGAALDASRRHLHSIREKSAASAAAAAAAAAASNASATKVIDSKSARFIFSNPLHKHIHHDQDRQQQHRHDIAAATTPVQQRPVDKPDYGSSGQALNFKS